MDLPTYLFVASTKANMQYMSSYRFIKFYSMFLLFNKTCFHKGLVLLPWEIWSFLKWQKVQKTLWQRRSAEGQIHFSWTLTNVTFWKILSDSSCKKKHLLLTLAISSVSATGAFCYIFLVWILVAWLQRPLETTAWIMPKDKEPPGGFSQHCHYKAWTCDPSCKKGEYNLDLFRRCKRERK